MRWGIEGTGVGWGGIRPLDAQRWGVRNRSPCPRASACTIRIPLNPAPPYCNPRANALHLHCNCIANALRLHQGTGPSEGERIPAGSSFPILPSSPHPPERVRARLSPAIPRTMRCPSYLRPPLTGPQRAREREERRERRKGTRRGRREGGGEGRRGRARTPHPHPHQPLARGRGYPYTVPHAPPPHKPTPPPKNPLPAP